MRGHILSQSNILSRNAQFQIKTSARKKIKSVAEFRIEGRGRIKPYFSQGSE